MDPLDVLVQDRIAQLRDDARRSSTVRSSHRRRLASLLHRVADLLDRRDVVDTVDTGMARHATACAR